MSRKANVPYGHVEDLGLQLVELPYADEEISMVILLPDEISDDGTGLEEVLTPQICDLGFLLFFLYAAVAADDNDDDNDYPYHCSVVVQIKPRAMCMLGKCSTPELHL